MDKQLPKLVLGGFWSAFFTPIRAIGLIFSTPSILALVIIPLLINIGIYSLFFYYGAAWLQTTTAAWIAELQTTLPAWAAWLAPVANFTLKILGWLLLILVSTISFSIVGSIIASPFNEFLSAKTERVLESKYGLPAPEAEQKISIKLSIWLEIKRTLILLLGGAAAFILGMLPLMQIPAILLGAMLVSFEYFGVSYARRTPSLLAVLWFTIRHLPASLGLGMFLFLLMAIPFASMVFIPLAVVSGAMIVVSKSQKQQG